MAKSTFKLEHPLVRRQAEAARIREKYPDIIPVIVEKAENTDIPDIDKKKALLSNLKRQNDDDLIKGQAINNQKALWNRNLEFRFLLQKAFPNSNKLPQESLRSQFCDLETIDKAYSELIQSSEQTLKSMLELQEVLVAKNTSISQENDASEKLEIGNDDDWYQLQRIQCS